MEETKIDLATVKDKVKDYIHKTVHVSKDKVRNDSLIFREGYFDSMGFILLITFLEETFNIKTSDSDLLEENFESIDAISNFVVTKLES